MLCKILEEPTFDVLRTKEQLGYSAHHLSYSLSGILGSAFYVQSSQKDPVFISSRIQAFLEEIMRPKFEALEPADLLTFIKSVLSARTQKDQTLKERVSRLTREILNH